MGFHQVFLLSPLQFTVTNSRNYRRLREFEEIEISRQVTVNSKKETSLRLWSGFFQEFGLSSTNLPTTHHRQCPSTNSVSICRKPADFAQLCCWYILPANDIHPTICNAKVFEAGVLEDDFMIV
jgi:hypothetical protein